MAYNTPRELIPKYAKPSSCNGCPLQHSGTGFSIHEGSGTNRVLIVGEALGAWEAKEGLPFRPNADAGSVLERAFRQIGMARAQFTLFNLVACRPPNNELSGMAYEFAAIAHCHRHLKAVFDAVQPTAILALGATAFRTLTGEVGDRKSLSDLRGYAFPSLSTDFAYKEEDGSFWHVPVIGSLHPSYIVRGAWNMFPVLCRDIRLAVSVAKGGFPESEMQFNENPIGRDLERMYDELQANPDLPLSIDWETTNSVDDPRERRWQNEVISQVNLSIRRRMGLALCNWEPHRKLIQSLCGLPNRKIGHNIWGFDYLVGVNNGIAIEGPIDDGMLKFHHLFPDLPGKEGKKDEDDKDGGFAPLQFVTSFSGFPFAWKSMSVSRPQWYGCCDVAAAIENDEWMTEEMQSLGIYDGYLELVAELAPVLNNMASRGIPFSKPKLLELDAYLAAKEDVVSKLIQETISTVAPDLMPTKQKFGLKKVPKDTAGLVERTFFIEAHVEKCKAKHSAKCKCVKPRKNVEFWETHPHAEVKKSGKLYSPEFECTLCNATGVITFDCLDCKNTGSYMVPGQDEVRWCKEEEFNANSGDQLRQYALTMGHKIPASSKSKGKSSKRAKTSKVSMDQEVVEKLAKRTKDPLYTYALEFKKISTLRTNFVVGWMPHDDGRVHPQFWSAPATGQLSSTRPNVMTAPNVSKTEPGSSAREMTERFNACAEAEPGHVWIGFDYKSFHAQTLGLAANCPEYVRLAKLDIHSYLASHLLKLPRRDEALSWTDAELGAWLEWIKKNHTKTRNKQAKPGILGYGFGLGGARLYVQNEDSFNNQKEADMVVDMLDRIFPAVARFRNTIPLVAQKQGGKLISEHKCIRWFFDIQRHDFRLGRTVRGQDWEKAIAFLPANNAFGMIKLAMLELEYAGFTERFGLVNQVHDALKFHCPVKLADECIHTVKAVMEQPSKVLVMPDGSPFSVDVDAEMGTSWLTMEHVK